MRLKNRASRKAGLKVSKGKKICAAGETLTRTNEVLYQPLTAYDAACVFQQEA